MKNPDTNTRQSRSPRFGYETPFWALIGAGLLTGWLLRWSLAPILPSGGWTDLTATLTAMAAGGAAAGALARWLRRRRHGSNPDR